MKKQMISLYLAVALVGAISPPVARAAGMEVEPAAQAPQSAAQEEVSYTNGTKAMDEQRWADAVTAFDQVAAAKGKHADAAIYWKAYALDKLGRKDEATATCEILRQQQPTSPWLKECLVLRARGAAMDARQIAELERQGERIRIRTKDGSSIPGGVIVVGPNGERTFKSAPRTTSEDDIKLLAVNVLMQQEPAKALPLLHDMILSDKSIEVRRQALFVLSRSKDPQAQSMLLDVATNSKDSALQTEAIQVLSMQRAKEVGPTLVQIYRGSSDAKVKRAVLNGLFLAHDAARLVDLARGEKDLNLKRDIVSQLALMHDPVATAYMEELLK